MTLLWHQQTHPEILGDWSLNSSWKTQWRGLLYCFSLFLSNTFPADALFRRASCRKVWCRGFKQVSLQEPAGIVSIFLALLVHLRATECGWFGLCAVTEAEVSCPAHVIALLHSLYSLPQVPVGSASVVSLDSMPTLLRAGKPAQVSVFPRGPSVYPWA